MSGLYIHIPFCQRKCFYCSFAVVVAQENKQDDYIEALKKEASAYQGAEIKTIYLGGGTPSLLNVSALAKLFAMIKATFVYPPECEITVEANPENLDLEKAKFLFGLGVNRVSLGVQTFDDKYLKLLGRAHDSYTGLRAFNDLRRAGFKNINVDLMYSFPAQTLDEIKQDAQTVLGLGSEHISIYTLTVEPNSKFYAQRMPQQDNALQGQQYQLVTTLLEQSGVKQYEVSNFCREGFESKHNINYWESGNYIGLGVSSHSHFDGRRSWNTSRLADYLKMTQGGLSPQEADEILLPQMRLKEAFVFGLRINRGVNIAALEQRLSCQLPVDVCRQIKILTDEGFLVKEGQWVRATDKGRLLLDEIAVKLI